MKRPVVVLLAYALPQAAAQFLECGPPLHTSPGVTLTIQDASGTADSYGGHLPFQYSGTLDFYGNPIDDAHNPVLVVPSKGTTPAAVQTALNTLADLQYPPGAQVIFTVRFTTVGVTPASGDGCQMTHNIPSEPNPAIQAVLDAASLQPVLSPGALVTVLGTHLTGPTQSTNYGPTVSYPTTVVGTSVTFNGIAAPLLYISPTQINAIVPFALAGQTTAQVVVQRFTQTSAPVTIPIQSTSPGIFTATQTGSGQAAILQQGSDGSFTYNSSANPAPSGTALELFATGMGVWTPPTQSDLSLFGGFFTTQPVSVTIGGQVAKVLYTGTIGAALSSWSVLQVNVVVPSGLGTGPQPILLKIGANDNSPQKVTVWVQ